MKQKSNVGRKKKMPDLDIVVKKSSKLLAYLLEHYAGKSRSEVKSYLAHRQIAVNGKTQTHFDYDLAAGDVITFRVIGEEKPNPNHKVRVVYEDEFLLVVDKKCGVLSVSTRTDDVTPTAFSVMKEHVRRRGKENRLYVVHKLDRDVSGLMVFAKDEETQNYMQGLWRSGRMKRGMVAVVEEELEKSEGEIVSWLTEDARSLKVTANEKMIGESRAVTRYSTIKTNGKFTLINIEFETDYKHQVRAQLVSIGHPIAGDKKYGAETNPLGRLCLHLNYMEFLHPYTKRVVKFDTGVPTIFK